MISVVIIVKNDPKLEETLIALEKIDKQEEVEIIVVDASTKDFGIKEKFNNVNFIPFKGNGVKRYTIPEQRNAGIQAAKGDLIVFIDSSCVPSKEWLVELVRPIRDEHEMIVSGATFSTNKQTLNDLDHIKKADLKYIEECATINLAFKKSLVEKIGLFDERFDYGSDVDFSWRVRDAGIKIRYAPAAKITHDWGDVNQEFKRTLVYGQARARLYIKHRNRLKNVIALDPVVLVYPILIIFIPFILFVPWLIFIITNISLLLKNIRDPKSVYIILKHYIYGLGVLKEVVRHILRIGYGS